MKQPNIPQFQANFRRVVETTRSKGGIPVILSAVERKGGVEKSTLAGYPEAAKAVADETKTLFIDMNGESRKLYKALGSDLNAAFQDGTHHNNFGSYEISAIVMQGIRDNKIDDLIQHFRPEVKPFDPTKPDKPADYKIPVSPKFSNQTPLGS
jgi:Mrp family chromosome partitioning ATPase